jgi:hypothetical protein
LSTQDEPAAPSRTSRGEAVDFLDDRGSLTVREFADLSERSRANAGSILRGLELAGVVRAELISGGRLQYTMIPTAS